MPYITLPTPERTRSGWEEFSAGLQPGLQQAFAMMMQRQLQEQQRQRNIQQAQQMFPEAFAQPSYEELAKQRGMPTQGLQYPTMLSPREREAFYKDIYTRKFGEKVPAQFLKFAPQAAQKYPGLGIDLTTGAMEYKVPQPDLLTQLRNLGIPLEKIIGGQPTPITEPQISSLSDLGINTEDLMDMDEDEISDYLESATSNLPVTTQPPSLKLGILGGAGTALRIGATPQSQAELRIWENWQKQSAKNKLTVAETFNTLLPIFQQLVSSWKAAAQEKQTLGVPTGLLSKIMAGTADKLELEKYPYTKAYMGQRIETALMLNKLITGQNRVIRDVIKQILVTLPTDTGIVEDMKAKIAQSLRNSFARTMGRKLSSEEFAFIDREIASVLATPSMIIPTGGQPDLRQQALEELRRRGKIK